MGGLSGRRKGLGENPGRHRDLDRPFRTDQRGGKPVLRGAFQHCGAERNEPHRIVAAPAPDAAQPPVERPVGQFAALLPGLADAQPMHPVAALLDHQRAGDLIPARGNQDMAHQHVMRMIRNQNLTRDTARKSAIGGFKRGLRGAGRKEQEQEEGAAHGCHTGARMVKARLRARR